MYVHTGDYPDCWLPRFLITALLVIISNQCHIWVKIFISLAAATLYQVQLSANIINSTDSFSWLIWAASLCAENGPERQNKSGEIVQYGDWDWKFSSQEFSVNTSARSGDGRRETAGDITAEPASHTNIKTEERVAWIPWQYSGGLAFYLQSHLWPAQGRVQHPHFCWTDGQTVKVLCGAPSTSSFSCPCLHLYLLLAGSHHYDSHHPDYTLQLQYDNLAQHGGHHLHHASYCHQLLCHSLSILMSNSGTTKNTYIKQKLFSAAWPLKNPRIKLQAHSRHFHIQGTFGTLSSHIQVTFKSHSGDIQETFRTYCSHI